MVEGDEIEADVTGSSAALHHQGASAKPTGNPKPPNSRRRLFRMIIPKYAAFNVYSYAAKRTTALGPLCEQDARLGRGSD